MLKVECEACKAPYQVDERRVPPTGQRMRCPKCGHTFTVMNPNAGATPTSSFKRTMVGVAVPPSTGAPPAESAQAPAAAKPAAKRPPPVVAPLPDVPGLGGIDDFSDLPAPQQPDLPSPVKPLPPVQPTLLSRQEPHRGAAAQALPDDLGADLAADLPSPVADLPSPFAARGSPGAPELPVVKPAAPLGGGPGSFDIGLPSPATRPADLPARKGPPPVPRKGPPPPPPAPADLPAKREQADLPAVFGDVGLPAPARGGGFGSIDLPSVGGGAGLPSPARGGGFGSIDLPSVGGGVGLPAPAPVGLPAATDQAGYLPRAAGPDAHLPTAAHPDAHLPTAARADAHLPAPADALPAVFGGAFTDGSTAVSGGSFGEALFGDIEDMPPPGDAGGATPLDSAAMSGVDAAAQPATEAVGGVGFGELDLGLSSGGTDVEMEQDVGGPAPLAASAGEEAALPTTDQPAAKPRERKVTIRKGQSRAPKLILAGFAAAVVAGALLQFTDYGMYGYKAINDSIYKTEWNVAATQAMATARKALGADLYDQCRDAADAIASRSSGLPRARGLIAAAALAEYEFQVRFGRDASRATRADAWLKAIEAVVSKPNTLPYYAAAAAGRAAAAGDIPAARSLLDAAAQKDPGDPVQQDVALIRGEIELKGKDIPAAIKAFERALQVAPNARAHYGLARCAVLTGDKTRAHTEIGLALAATPKHPGALVLKARLDWDDDRNDGEVIAGLSPLLDGPAKATASPPELAAAFTLFGLAQASRGDVGAARTAFESALKLDARNVDALIGQGEVFYADGRYTEALSRFDTAVQADPSNPSAIVADAKAKIALDRLADAKAQLATAQKAMPKVMKVTYWLGRTEEALGDRKGAEDAYLAAIAVMDPKDREAILPYVALSTLLAAQGRAAEAQARLTEARAKLPDSAAMQRALGEVSVAQGLYDEAIAHFQTAFEKDSHDLRAQFLLGETYLRMRRFDDAAAHFDKVAAADPDYPNLAMRRGELLEASGHIVQALEQFKAALERAPKDLDMQLRVGAAYVGAGRGTEGFATLKPVYDQRQNSAEVNHYLGRALLLQGGTHLPDAMRYLQKAVDIDPTRAEYHLYLAWGATESQDWKLGETEVGKALASDQMLGDAYWQRAVIEEVKGNVEDAIRDATKALELRPGRNEAHATLAKCYADKNRPDLALNEWATATAREADRPDWEYLYGRLLHEQGKYGQALPHVVLAAKASEAMNPAPPWATHAEFLAADGLRRAGNKVDAKEHYHRYLDKGERSSPDYRDAQAALHAIDPTYVVQ